MTWDVVVSCKVNLFLGGSADEPLCSRVWFNSLFSWQWEVLRKVFDFMFSLREHDHCWQCHLRYLRRRRRKNPPLFFSSIERSLPEHRLRPVLDTGESE